MPTPAAADSDDVSDRPNPSPIVVALAGWLLPGAGYWLLGERARGLVVGVTIIILFTAGTLIGGVRAIQVPAYGEGGGRLRTWYDLNGKNGPPTGRTIVLETAPEPQSPNYSFRYYREGDWVATDFRGMLTEIGNKPWSICQIMAGPLAIVGGAASVWASHTPGGGELSHSRINEIAVLYTAVAGMLNLLVMIDAAARALRGHTRAASADAAPAGAST